MKSESTGTDTSAAEVLNVSPHGFWVMVGAKEYFLDFDHFPWFRRGSLEQLFKVELLHGEHLYWPDLDVDLDLDRIEHPENYPLVANTETRGEPDAGGNSR
jgi:hypothetical protein